MHGSVWTYNDKGGRHRVLTRVEFQEMIYRLATLVECSLKFTSAPYLIFTINGLRGRRKKGKGDGEGKKVQRRRKGKGIPAIRGGVSAIFLTNPITSTIQYVTNHKQRCRNLITLFTRNCQVETPFFNQKTFYCCCSRSKHDQHRLFLLLAVYDKQ